MSQSQEKIVKRLRFTWDDEVCLLKEIVAQNNADTLNWEEIQSNIAIATGKNFPIKTLKQHLESMLEKFLIKITTDLKSSGKETVYSEKDHLLEELSKTYKKFKGTPPKKTKKTETIADSGRKLRESLALKFSEAKGNENVAPVDENPACSSEHSYNVEMDLGAEIQLEDVDEESEDVVPLQENMPERAILAPRKRRMNRKAETSMKMSSLTYLQNKEKVQNELRKRELDLEERKIELEEKKLQLEERRLTMDLEERRANIEIEKKKMDLEMKERDHTLAILAAQQKLISILESKINN